MYLLRAERIQIADDPWIQTSLPGYNLAGARLRSLVAAKHMPTSSSTNSNSRGLHLERAEGGHKRHFVGLFQPLVWNQARRLLINRPEMLDGVREGVWRTDEEGLVGIRILPRPQRPPPSILRRRGV